MFGSSLNRSQVTWVVNGLTRRPVLLALAKCIKNLGFVCFNVKYFLKLFFLFFGVVTIENYGQKKTFLVNQENLI
jgi:hypothetical protein